MAKRGRPRKIRLESDTALTSDEMVAEPVDDGGGRQSNGRFAPGNTIGHQGRRMIDPTVKEMLKKASPEAIALLVNTMRNENIKIEVRVACAKEILDRAYGKPAQAVSVDVDNIPQVVIVGEEKLID